MTDPAPAKCDKGGPYCGTPNGWRRGGRCRRCRTAHNADLRKRRGLTPEQRAHFLRLLRAGQSTHEAAASAGVPAGKVAAASSLDGELRAALDGYPQAIQRAARLGDYLAALTRTGGDVNLAVRISAVGTTAALYSYRKRDPLFNSAEKAVLVWIDQATQHTRSRVSDELLDQAARMLEDDPTVALQSVADTIGVADATSIRHAASRHERLRAALPAPGVRNRVWTSKFTPEKDQLLREMWPDKNHSVVDIANLLGVSPGGAKLRANVLGLPPRTTARTGRRGIPASPPAPTTKETPECLQPPGGGE